MSTSNLFSQMYTNSIIIREEVTEIVDSIAIINRFDRDAISFDGHKPQSFKFFERLIKHASTQELIQLVEHNNAVVQCYSIKALGQKDSVDLLPILISQLTNLKHIQGACGCFPYTMKVFDYAFSEIEYHRKYGKITLDDKQINEIDSIILYNDYSDYFAYLNQFRNTISDSNKRNRGIDMTLSMYQATSLNEILNRIEPKKSYYERIREIAVDSICGNVIITLAKYKEQKDIPIIKKFFPKYHIHDTYLKAIFEFPDTIFLNDLYLIQLQYLDIEYCRAFMICNYYTTLVQFKNQQSIEIINYGIENLKYDKNLNCHLDALYAALELYPDNYYERVKNNIELNTDREERIKSIMNYYKIKRSKAKR